MLKNVLVGIAMAAFFLGAASGEEANGLRLTAQKVTLEKDKDKDAFDQWDKVKKALGIKVAARNISFKDMPEGTLEYVVIVKRWGQQPELLESYTGSEKLPALLKGADVNLTIGKVPMSGYEIGGNRKEFSDSIEGWQVIANHEGKQTVKITSTAAFEKLLTKAKPARKQ